MSVTFQRIAQGLSGRVSCVVIGIVAGVCVLIENSVARAETSVPSAVMVAHAGRKCFIRSVHATGYIVPRASAVVMFNAPDFKISDLMAKPGDVVERGDAVAKAVAVTQRPGGSAANPDVVIHTLASGLVLKSTAFVGMPTSAQGEPLFTLALDGDLEAMVDVPGIHVFEIEAGQIAHVSMRDGTVLDGHLRLAPVIIDHATQSGQARIAFEAGAHLALGQFVRATIEANRSCGVGVPRAALKKSSEGPQIQVVDDGIVATRTVKLGLSSETDIEITEGLREGEVVVGDAGTALREGDRIKPVYSDAQDSP